jgi:hypothetical protein
MIVVDSCGLWDCFLDGVDRGEDGLPVDSRKLVQGRKS